MDLTFVGSNGLVLAALIAAAVAVVTSIAALIGLRRVMRPLRQIDPDSQPAAEIIPAVLRLVEKNEESVAGLRRALEDHTVTSRRHLAHVGFVRYNAFEDIAGQQSYSLCLLDGHHDGVLMTYLTGKSSTRSYAISIAGGKAPRKLSDEEAQVLKEAIDGRAAATVAESSHEPQPQTS